MVINLLDQMKQIKVWHQHYQKKVKEILMIFNNRQQLIIEMKDLNKLQKIWNFLISFNKMLLMELRLINQ